MSEFSIKISVIPEQIENIRQVSSSLLKINEDIEKIKKAITIGETFVQSIKLCQEEIFKEENQLSSFITALEQIVEMYKSTEERIIGNKNVDEGNNEIQTSEEQETETSDERQDDQGSLDEWTAEKLGISEDTWKIVKFILGFIPVVNVATDIYQIADDVNKALSDGKLSCGEFGGIITDMVFCGLDLFAAGQIIKGLKGVTKAAKIAKTESKVASETAEQLAKKAEKATIKSGGSVPTTKAAQKATKAADRAEKAAKKAEEAAKASKEANKTAAKSMAKDIVKGTVDNVADEYGVSGKPGIPYAVIREERDKAIEAG